MELSLNGGEMQNKYLGVFLVAVTIPFIIIAIFLLGTNKLSTSKYYEDLFKKSDAYNLAIQALPKTNISHSEANSNNIWTVISNKITTPWLEKNISANLDQFDAYFNGHSSAIDPSVDISLFKNDLTTDLPKEFKGMVPDTISFSTYNDYLSQAKSYLLKNSSGDTKIDQDNLTQINQQIDSTRSSQQQFLQNTSSIKTGYHLFKTISYVAYVLAILMLIVIILASRHWVPAIFRWAGQTLLIGGLLSLIIAFFGQKILINFDFISKLNMDDKIKQVFTPLYHNVLADITSSIGCFSLIVALIGLVFVIFSYILPKFISKQELPSITPSK